MRNDQTIIEFVDTRYRVARRGLRKVELGGSRNIKGKNAAATILRWAAFLGERLATTYSRGTYRTTTIGKTVFDGRVRDGIGSGHRFMVTNKFVLSEGAKSDVANEGRCPVLLQLLKNLESVRLGCKSRLRRVTLFGVFIEYYTQGGKLRGVFTTRFVLKSLQSSLGASGRSWMPGGKVK